ncbi:MAG: DUF1566 domain-containing protein [Deltaproteobacteria bacterium]|nr:DUF1566 domain-containing protein [Deltaproteobacteria bacterium]
MVIGTCFTVSAFADFYVISAPKEVMPENYAPVEKTGQANCHDSSGSIIICTGTGHDGDLQKGVAWPNPRFTNNSNGTVTDNLTGLIWLKAADCLSGNTVWASALDFCNNLSDGSCLTDGSSAGDWRLPNVRELQSLIHYGVDDPALPNTSGTGKWATHDPFTNVQSNYYWTSSTAEYYTDYAWCVDMDGGRVTGQDKDSYRYVWCVRGGN